MPGPTMELELPVEPQSLKMLSFKSLKRALDIFSLLHSQFLPPDSESKKIRLSHKFEKLYHTDTNTTTFHLISSKKLAKSACEEFLTKLSYTFKLKCSCAIRGQYCKQILKSQVSTTELKVIRSYHGHLSGVYCLALHPTIDVLLIGGRDSVCRVWDIRSKMQIHALSGHDNTVCSVFTRPTHPQVVYFLGRAMATLTHHKKSVRVLAQHPTEDSFASASADNIKKFSLPRGEFVHNVLSQQKTIINAMAVNEEGVLATGGENGSLWFWDWKSGHSFQQSQTIVQPGSLDSEAGIYALSYDTLHVKQTKQLKCGKKTKMPLQKLTLSTSSPRKISVGFKHEGAFLEEKKITVMF